MRFLRSTENQTLVAILLGTLLGLLVPGLMLRLTLVGEVFLRLLKMTIAPLIFASVFVSAAGMGSLARLREIGLRTLAYYLLTTALAVATGLLVVNLVRPGAEAAAPAAEVEVRGLTLHDLVLGLLPENAVGAVAQGEVLPIITFALLFGLATLSLAEDRRRGLVSFFEAANEALITLVRWVVRLTPLGVGAIVGGLVAREGLAPLASLSSYALSVVAGLALHAAVTLGLILRLLGGESPWRYFLRVREAVMVAFSTASSAATLPVSLEVAEKRAGVPARVAGFVLPLGATVNMDGTALYEAVAALFIANVYHVSLSPGEQVLVFLTATLASIGAAGIPSAGLVTMTLVLQSVGLPLEGIGLILAVDRFLDMVRTAVNVWGDLIGARIVARFAAEPAQVDAQDKL